MIAIRKLSACIAQEFSEFMLEFLMSRTVSNSNVVMLEDWSSTKQMKKNVIFSDFKKQ